MAQQVIFFAILELGSLSGGTRAVSFNLPRPLQTAQGSIIRTFINGLISNSASEVSISVTKKSLTATNFEANVEVGSSIVATKVYISYLTLTPSTAGFVSYGAGINEKNFATTKVYDLHKNVYNSPYVFYGFINL